MKTYKIYLLLICLVTLKLNAQINLVPNPSFEEYWSCPNGSYDIYKVKNWFNAGGTPDCFNACSSTVPSNGVGFQQAAIGNAYAGIVCYYNVNGVKNFREYISVLLTNTLTIGTKYFVSFKTSAGFSQSTNVNIFTNNLGAYFSKYKLDSISSTYAINKWHIVNTSVVNDTTNWIRIVGNFIADSNYKYITVGNVKDSSGITIDSNITHTQGFSPYSSYYYLDDVCVSTDSAFTYSYVPTMINRNSTDNVKIKIFPNPASQIVNITSDINIKQIKIYNYLGKEVYNMKYEYLISDTTIPFSTEKIGIYFIEVTNSNNEKNNYKLIKN